MVQVTIEEAKTRLADLISEALNGETVFIREDDNKVVLLVPVAHNRGTRKFGSAKGLIHMAEDFDEPLEDFKEYME